MSTDVAPSLPAPAHTDRLGRLLRLQFPKGATAKQIAAGIRQLIEAAPTPPGAAQPTS